MIAIESFKRFRIKDLIIIMSFSVIYLIIDLIISFFNHPQYNYILSFFFFIFILTFLVYLVRRAGTAALFGLTASIFTSTLGNLDITGQNKIIILTLLGILFEIVFLILKLEIKLLPLDVILSVALASAIIPIISIISIKVNSPTILFNLSLLNFFIAISASIISFLLWFKLKTKRLIIEFEYL